MPLLDALRAALAGPRASASPPAQFVPGPHPHPPPLDLRDLPPARVREAVEDDRGWHTLTGQPRDLRDSDRNDQLTAADRAWRLDPLANRIVELTCDLVLGNGVSIRAERPEVQAIVDEFWSHPLNRMQLRQFEWCRELTLTGELFVTLFTNPIDDMTYVRALPASLIDQIETNPNDLEDELRFHQVAGQSVPAGGGGVSASPRLRVPASASPDGRWWEASEMRHYAINRLLGTTRGQGDLVPVLRSLRQYRNWIADRVTINKYKGAYLWDVTLIGADRPTVLARQAELAFPPRPGSLLVHSDGEEWRALAPHIDAPDVAADGKALRRLVAAGAGVPLHFLAEADEGNRAVAREQARPTNLHFQRRQLTFGLILVDVCLEVVRRTGRVPSDQIGRLEPVFPDTEPADNVQLAQAALDAARALQLAESNGWLTRPDAAALFQQFLGGIASPTRGPVSASGAGRR